MKKFISISFLFFTLFSIQVLAQLESIKEFPRAYESQAVFNLTPVWISGNEILVFYKNATYDTIFSRRTTNLGKTWSAQKFEQIVEVPIPPYFYSGMYSYKLANGRILFLWRSTESEINCNYSDDNGYNWVNTETIISNRHYPSDFSILEIDEGKIVLSFSTRYWNTRLSTDNGETWTDEDYYNLPYGIFSNYRNPHLIKLSESGDSLLGIFTRGTLSAGSIIYSILSTNGGANWSDSSRVIETNFPDPNYFTVKAIQDSEQKIWLIYDADYDLEIEDYSQTDVSVLVSTDNGQSWHSKDNFSSYLGDDDLTGVTLNGDNILACFNSVRNNIYYEGYFGIVELSEDTYTPPILLNQGVEGMDYENDKFIYRALVIDDEFVLSVNLDIENGEYQSEMFDDGMHNDSLANDNIFGNTFPLIPPNSASLNLEAYQIEVNNISLPFDERGVIADINIGSYPLQSELKMIDNQDNISIKNPNLSIPFQNPGSGGKYAGSSFLFSSGFFLSGYSDGEMWSNAVASAHLVEDYRAGQVGRDPDETINKIYVIGKDHIPFGSAWQNWKNAVSLGAEFYDGDGDGIYNPVDKNWNGTWDLNEDMPPIIGDEIAWCVYNDALPKNNRRWNTVDPQGIEVRQTIFASNNPDLENVVFIRYSILNTGLVADVMDSVYFGIWEDGDMGEHTNDVVGCDTLLNSAFYYENEFDFVYGDNPPAFFSTFLQGPIVSTNHPSDSAKTNFGQHLGFEIFPNSKNLDISSHTLFIGGDPNLNDPGTAVEARNYLLGEDRMGQLPNPCTFAYGQVRGGSNCNEINKRFWFSGDPVTNIGWICRVNQDMRNLVSTGPFQLVKNESQEIIVAYVIGRGTDYFNSITVARENVQRAIEEYQSNFASMTYSAPPATNPVNSYVLYQNYPNPFNPVTTIRYELPQDGQVTIDIFDILGQKVGTLVNEYKKADRYEITFRSTGLASGVYIYQLRVNDFITSKKMVLIK